jgi:hypothetical protein
MYCSYLGHPKKCNVSVLLQRKILVKLVIIIHWLDFPVAAEHVTIRLTNAASLEFLLNKFSLHGQRRVVLNIMISTILA